MCNCLSAQSMCALLCLGSWSLARMVKNEDVLKAALMNDVDEKIEGLCSYLIVYCFCILCHLLLSLDYSCNVYN